MIEIKNKDNQVLNIVRSQTDEIEEVYIEFYASVYNQYSKPFFCPSANKNIVEVIKASAFDQVLNHSDLNCIATVFHDKTKIIGRIKASTLTLISDDYGLKARVKMGNTQLHRDTIEQIERGDLFECSFIASTDDFEYTIEDGQTVRYINSVLDLKDVSIVGDGQYSNTIIMKRNMEDKKEELIDIKNDEQQVEEVKDEKTVDVSEDKEKVIEVVNEEKPQPEKEEVIELENNKTEDQSKKEVKEVIEIQNDNKNEEKNMKTENTYLDLMRGVIENPQGGRLELVRAGETTTTTSANVIPKAVSDLSIKGLEPVWEKLGADFFPNANGTIKLPYKSPAVGQAVAELVAITKDTISPSGNLLTPKRYGYTFEISLETLASATDGYLQKLIVDGQKGAYRKFETEVYKKLVAGAGEVSTATAVDYDSLTELEGAIDTDGEVKIVSGRKTFFTAKKVFIDAGSGEKLVSKKSNNEGETTDGTSWLFSGNFTSDANTEYIVAGDMGNGLAIADYNKTEVLINPYSRDTEGIVRVTVNLLMDSALKNPTVVKKSVDLDPAA